MAVAKLRKANITSPYPTARDVADFLHVPKARVERLAEELLQFHQNDKKSETRLLRKKRIGRASRA